MATTVQCVNPSCGFDVTQPEGQRVARCPRCNTELPHAGETFGTGVFRLAGETAGEREARPAGEAAAPVPRAPGPQPNAATIGRYQIRAKLGAGAFGTVYRAFDPQKGCEVALKVPNPGTLDNANAIARFVREAKSAGQLKHPNIVAIHEVQSENGLHYIASEFIDGRTLAEAIAADDLDYRRGAQIVGDLADALYFAHRHKIIHRDVKPANVMLDASNVPHLMDFGLAHQRDATTKLTQTGAIMGTPAYMAPEQARGQTGKPRAASDQYSLGVVLYELLTGRIPFMGPLPVVMAAILTREPTPPRSINPEAPAELETICLKAMAKAPADRYQSCRALAEDLRRYLQGEPIEARRTTLLGRSLRSAGSTKLALGAVAAIVVLFAAAVLGLVLRGSRTSSSDRDAVAANVKAAPAAAPPTKTEPVAPGTAATPQVADPMPVVAPPAADGPKPLTPEEQAEKDRLDAESAARRAREAALDRELMQRSDNYLTDLRGAHKAWEAGKTELARQLLEKHLPAPGAPREDDLRGFEWFYVHTLATGRDPNLAISRKHSAPILDLAYAPDATHLAVLGDDRTVSVWPTTGSFATQLAMLKGVLRPSVATVMTAKSQDGLGNNVDLLILGTGDEEGMVRFWSLAPTTADSGSGFSLPGPSFLPTRSRSGRKRSMSSGPGLPGGAIPGLGEGGPGGARPQDDKPAQGTYNPTEIFPFGRLGSARSPIRRLVAREHGALGALITESGDLHLLNPVGATLSPSESTPGNTVLVKIKPAVGMPPYQFALPDSLRAVAYGKTAVTIADLGTANRSRRNALKGPKGEIAALALSSDAGTLAVAQADHSIQLWSLPAGKELATLTGHTSAVQRIAFTPDRKLLVSASADGAVQVWDLATGKSKVQHQAGKTTSLAVAPDGRYVVVGCADGTFRQWALGPGEPRTPARLFVELKNPGRQPPAGYGVSPVGNALAFSPDGETLAFASGRAIELWDVASRHLAAVLDEKSPSPGVASTAKDRIGVIFSSDGKQLFGDTRAAGGSSLEQRVEIWDVETGSLQRVLSTTGNAYQALAATPDGRSLVSYHHAGTFYVDSATSNYLRWNVGSGAASPVKLQPPPDPGKDKDKEKDKGGAGEQPASAGPLPTPGSRFGRPARSGRGFEPPPGMFGGNSFSRGNIVALACAPDGKSFVCSDGAHVEVVELETGRIHAALKSTGAEPDLPAVTAIAHGPRTIAVAAGNAAASVRSTPFQVVSGAAGDLSLRLYDSATRELKKELRWKGGPITSLSFTADGRTLAVASADQTVRIVDAPTGVTRLVLHDKNAIVGRNFEVEAFQSPSITSVAIAPQGRSLAVAYSDWSVRLWHLADPPGADTPKPE